jgi:hypothetical protein
MTLIIMIFFTTGGRARPLPEPKKLILLCFLFDKGKDRIVLSKVPGGF